MPQGTSFSITEKKKAPTMLKYERQHPIVLIVDRRQRSLSKLIHERCGEAKAVKQRRRIQNFERKPESAQTAKNGKTSTFPDCFDPLLQMQTVNIGLLELYPVNNVERKRFVPYIKGSQNLTQSNVLDC